MITVCNDRKFRVSWKIKDVDGSLVNLRNADPKLYLLGCGKKEEVSFDFVDDNTVKACIHEGLLVGVYSMLLNWTNSNCIPRHSLKENAFAITDIPNEEDIPVNYSTDLLSYWSGTDVGWLTEKIKADDIAYIHIRLKEKGRVIIKAADNQEVVGTKVFISPIGGPDFSLRISGDVKDKWLQICCSSEPLFIRSKGLVFTNYLNTTGQVIRLDVTGDDKWFIVNSNVNWVIK